MQPITTDGVAWSVRRLSTVGLFVTIVSLANTAESIEMPFGIWTGMGSRNHVLNGGPDPHSRIGNFEGEKGAGPGHARTCPAVTYSKRLSMGQQRYGVDADWGVL